MRNYWKSHNFTQLSEGAIDNFLTEEETGRVATAYGVTFKRLKEIKTKYDPENFFRMNQNIKPL